MPTGEVLNRKLYPHGISNYLLETAFSVMGDLTEIQSLTKNIHREIWKTGLPIGKKKIHKDAIMTYAAASQEVSNVTTMNEGYQRKKW